MSMSYAKTAELIEMLFGLWTLGAHITMFQVGFQVRLWEGALLEGHTRVVTLIKEITVSSFLDSP